MEEPTHEIERIEPSTSVFVFFGNCHTISDWGNNGEVSAKIRALDSPAAPVNFKQTLTVAITSEVCAPLLSMLQFSQAFMTMYPKRCVCVPMGYPWMDSLQRKGFFCLDSWAIHALAHVKEACGSLLLGARISHALQPLLWVQITVHLTYIPNINTNSWLG